MKGEYHGLGTTTYTLSLRFVPFLPFFFFFFFYGGLRFLWTSVLSLVPLLSLKTKIYKSIGFLWADHEWRVQVSEFEEKGNFFFPYYRKYSVPRRRPLDFVTCSSHTVCVGGYWKYRGVRYYHFRAGHYYFGKAPRNNRFRYTSPPALVA